MKTYRCDCGNRLFFHSTKCVRCGTESGMCPACDQVTPLLGHGDGVSCGNKSCGAPLRKCKNYLEHICNRMVECGRGDLSSVCNYCATTTVIPDLSVAGNKKKWQELERAKHRVLYMLDELGVPFGEGDDLCPPATFEFKADGEEPVATGHAKGCITINIREADSAAREQSRVEFGEPQRTLIGHLRHELGHYVWDRLVRGQDEEQYRRVFGDERNPTYQESLQKYYADGPNAGWQQQFISAYATMHPWEDFAETFNAYLDMRCVLRTANYFEVVRCEDADFEQMLESYSEVGMIANELNRDMGLLDLVPEVFVTPVAEKLRYIDSLIKRT